MPEPEALVTHRFLGSAAYAWALGAAIVVATFLLARTARRIARRRHQRLLDGGEVAFTEIPLRVLSKTSTAFLVVAALYAGLSAVELPPKAARSLDVGFTLVTFWQIGVWASSAALAWLEARQRTTEEVDRAASGSFGIVGVILRGVLWTLIGLLALDNLGVNITALVAGLGVGGIAVALALQNVLGDLFASLSITLDRPFVVGDFIVVGDFKGSVEAIGVKSTRLRSIDGEQIVIANADLLSSRVRNFGRMTERRVVLTVGVPYETPRDRLSQIPSIIHDVVEAEEGARFSRSHFSKFGDSALEFESVYFVLSADYATYMAVQETVNFGVLGAFAAADIEFAYPTQKLWIEAAQDAGKDSA